MLMVLHLRDIVWTHLHLSMTQRHQFYRFLDCPHQLYLFLDHHQLSLFQDCPLQPHVFQDHLHCLHLFQDRQRLDQFHLFLVNTHGHLPLNTVQCVLKSSQTPSIVIGSSVHACSGPMKTVLMRWWLVMAKMHGGIQCADDTNYIKREVMRYICIYIYA